MYNHDRDSFIMYFADGSESISMYDIQESRFSLRMQSFVQDFGLESLVVLNQTHGIDGLVVDNNLVKLNHWFEIEGDFLITQEKNIGLIVLTADCLPLVVHDSNKQVVGVIHIGWKGLYSGVVAKTLRALQTTFKSAISDLEFFVGPHARPCCYQVQESFISDFQAKYPELMNGCLEKLIVNKKNNDWYFNMQSLLLQMLQSMGVFEHNIHIANASCTVCNIEFCSWRRQKEYAGRQMTLVALQ